MEILIQDIYYIHNFLSKLYKVHLTGNYIMWTDQKWSNFGQTGLQALRIFKTDGKGRLKNW